MSSDRLKILFAQKYPLFPSDTGAKKRSLNVLQHMAKWHDVTYLCNHASEDEDHLPLMRELGLQVESLPWRRPSRRSLRFGFQVAGNVASAEPFTVATNTDASLQRRARKLAEDNDYNLLICDTVVMAPHVMDLNIRTKILFQHNVEAQIFERHAQSGGLLKRKYMHLQWRKMERYERMMKDCFDAFIAVSEEDRARFEQNYDWRNVYSIDTAVDTTYFAPCKTPEAPQRVVFLGSMDWMPNQEAVFYFLRKIWPRVRSLCPQAEFHIVGRNPPAAIRQLGNDRGVSVVGTVPDVRPHLAAAEVVVVPLLVGGGTRIKIFEALGMGKAVVSTSIGAEGLRVVPGEDLVIEDAPEAFATAVARLLRDVDERRRIGTNGRKLVVENFSTETVATQFNAICIGVHRNLAKLHSPDVS